MPEELEPILNQDDIPNYEQKSAELTKTLLETLEANAHLIPDAFSLDVGVDYVTYSGDRVKVVHQTQGRYLGLIAAEKSLPFSVWYTSDGFVDRNFDEDPSQDPFDIKKIHREPDSVFLIRKDGSYTHNNCFTSYNTAAEAAAARGGRVVEFLEVMED
jgi:hypothetical protein